ncbi:hypothetical protein A2994_03245 [candidate division Kazan bacterium RIFCSPLOWO2_01_FULL_48_13]|uniref:GIY-YIG domain-containing protein n=1 Tax=candidate division Kazan bacterium RIFCSPLOWO2_01_FULL_48_13 TaxID=1798539 RepID=A0A1F4PNS6_UNCK3|nr:MAG: hypothetical protein A2994_03245 [candidate division Kazan bacterium RIFCSPLOWO2_01_FULL_48_13]
MFYVYVLQSTIRDQAYVGFTTDPKNRLKEHNQGLNPSTKPYRPWSLIYYEACLNENDAKHREVYLKTTQGRRLLNRRLRDYRYQVKV